MSTTCTRCGASIATRESKAYVKVLHVSPKEMGDEYGSWTGRATKVVLSATICDACLGSTVEDVRGAVLE